MQRLLKETQSHTALIETMSWRFVSETGTATQSYLRSTLEGYFSTRWTTWTMWYGVPSLGVAMLWYSLKGLENHWKRSSLSKHQFPKRSGGSAHLLTNASDKPSLRRRRKSSSGAMNTLSVTAPPVGLSFALVVMSRTTFSRLVKSKTLTCAHLMIE